MEGIAGLTARKLARQKASGTSDEVRKVGEVSILEDLSVSRQAAETQT